MEKATRRIWPALVLLLLFGLVFACDNGTGNIAPTAAITAATEIEVGKTLTLDGSGSSDPEGATLSYSWSVKTKPATSETIISKPTEAIAEISPDIAGDYVVSLEVSDGNSKVSKEHAFKAIALGGGASLVVDKATLTISLEATEKCKVTALKADGTADTFAAASNKEAIATVTISGTTLSIKGMAIGDAVVTITGGSGLTKTIAITVTKATLGVDKTTLSLVNGSQGPLISTAAKTDGSVDTISATSSADGVATVAVSGLTATVTGVAAGTATITITSGSGLTKTIEVTVTAVTGATSLTLDKATLSVMKGYQGAITATAKKSDDSVDTISATSSASTVATVTVNGLIATVTGVADGTAIITITSGSEAGLSKTVTVTVASPAGTSSLTLNKTTLNLTKGNQGTITATATKSDGGADTISATSNASTVATVAVNGLLTTVTSVAVGTATITITSGSGLSKTVSVTVAAAPVGSSLRTKEYIWYNWDSATSSFKESYRDYYYYSSNSTSRSDQRDRIYAAPSTQRVRRIWTRDSLGRTIFRENFRVDTGTLTGTVRYDYESPTSWNQTQASYFDGSGRMFDQYRYAYDSDDRQIEYSYYSIDIATGTYSLNQQYKYLYDADGHTAGGTYIDGWSDPLKVLTLESIHDTAGNEIELRYLDGTTLVGKDVYTYNSAGRMLTGTYYWIDGGTMTSTGKEEYLYEAYVPGSAPEGPDTGSIGEVRVR